MSASAHAWIACEICGRAHSRDAPCPYPPGRHRGSGVNGVLVEGDGAALVRGRTRLRHWLGDMSGPERESFGHGHHLLSSAGLDSASPMAPSEGSAS